MQVVLDALAVVRRIGRDGMHRQVPLNIGGHRASAGDVVDGRSSRYLPRQGKYQCEPVSLTHICQLGALGAVDNLASPRMAETRTATTKGALPKPTYVSKESLDEHVAAAGSAQAGQLSLFKSGNLEQAARIDFA